MARWSDDELARIADAPEMRISTERADGSLRAPLPVWAVRVGDEIVVRSYRGPPGEWYRQARRSARGWISAGGVERDIVFGDGERLDRGEVDAAYRLKYGTGGYVDAMTRPEAAAATLVVEPAR